MKYFVSLNAFTHPPLCTFLPLFLPTSLFISSANLCPFGNPSVLPGQVQALSVKLS